MTRKRIVLVSFVLSALSVISIFSRQINVCPNYSYSNCANFFDTLFIILSPFVFLFIFSLITYPMRENVFQLWWKFARVWMLISMLAILISPSNSHNWMFPIEKGIVASFSFLVHSIVSIIIILSRYYALKRGYSYPAGVLFSVFSLSFVIAIFIFISLARML